MPGETALTNVRKYDFFAILGSGTYVVGSYGLLAAAVFNHRQKLSAPETLRWISGILERHWPVAVASLFLAFLIGNVLRALPISRMDDLSKKWFHDKSGIRKWFHDKSHVGLKKVDLFLKKWSRDKLHIPFKDPVSAYELALWTGSFPYPDRVKVELEALTKGMLGRERSLLEEVLHDLVVFSEKNQQHTITTHSVPQENPPAPVVSLSACEVWHSAYNFWKAELCRESTTAFEYTQELEGRVRLFATMIWGSFLGLLAGVMGLLLNAKGLLGPDWAVVMVIMVILSAVICYIFGSYLRRVRGQEVASVFLAYVSLILDRSRNKSASSK
ncbi:MAG: hypothetical protein ABSG78_11560 [Verrucomicrobiota bacterium]|jgi:hypothetical protein